MGKNIEVYESLINKILSNELNEKANSNSIYKEKLEPGTSGSIIASYIKIIVEKGLRHYKSDNDDLSKQIEITNKIIENLSVLVEESELEKYSLTEEYMLKAIGDKLIAKDNIKQLIPQTSVASSSLFTGAMHEPPVYSELKREIASADRIDLLVSFIKFSGLRLIYDDLKEHTKSKKLRVITTSYMGASDLKAIQELAKLPNTEVKVSYDTNRTRLHAKAYYFHRNTGFSTAYIGSSNLSQAALSEGTEWNMKVSEYFFDLVPYAYQQEILDRLEIEREVYNSYHNLIVAATGARVIIVTGCINVLISRVSETFIQKNSCIT